MSKPFQLFTFTPKKHTKCTYTWWVTIWLYFWWKKITFLFKYNFYFIYFFTNIYYCFKLIIIYVIYLNFLTVYIYFLRLYFVKFSLFSRKNYIITQLPVKSVWQQNGLLSQSIIKRSQWKVWVMLSLCNSMTIFQLD